MENLRSIREDKRITQVRLSKEIGIAQETISAYESGKSLPSADALCKLADYLKTSTDFLLQRTETATPIQELRVGELALDEMEIIAHFRRLDDMQKAKVLGFIMGLEV